MSDVNCVIVDLVAVCHITSIHQHVDKNNVCFNVYKTTGYYAATCSESVSVCSLKMPLLSHHLRFKKNTGMVEAGLQYTNLARRLAIHRHAVRNTVRRFAVTGSVADLP